MEKNEMRIQVNPDGNIQFSVELSSDIDPSLVASMVAAVRRGIAATTTNPSKPLSHSQTIPSVSAHTSPPDHHAEPTSDPDPGTARAPDRNCERVPSPLIISAARKLSVRQIASEIDTRPDTLLPSPYSEYDPIREFSSTPALRADSNTPYVEPDPPRSQSSAYYLRPSASDCDVKPTRRVRGERPIDRIVEQTKKSRQSTNPHQHSSARPVRMLSLPNGISHDTINDMYVIRHQSEHTADHDHHDPRNHYKERTASLDLIHEGEILVEERSITRQGHIADVPVHHQNTPLSQRSISDLTDPHEFSDPHDFTNSHDLDGERSITPSSPYVQQQVMEQEDPNDAWENVEYVLTDSYRNDAKPVDTNDRHSQAVPINSRSAAWRLFSSIGLRRRQDLVDDVHQSTLATGSGYNDKLPKRRRALFMRNNLRNGMLWMEFTSPLSIERMLAEVGKIAKSMGYQVWRRPGENKLRCIRRLNHRHEMHLVILVGSIRLPEGQVSVIRLRRARGDRNRTEGWRYAHFYRELIDRLQRHGIEITAGE